MINPFTQLGGLTLNAWHFWNVVHFSLWLDPSQHRWFVLMEIDLTGPFRLNFEWHMGWQIVIVIIRNTANKPPFISSNCANSNRSDSMYIRCILSDKVLIVWVECIPFLTDEELDLWPTNNKKLQFLLPWHRLQKSFSPCKICTGHLLNFLMYLFHCFNIAVTICQCFDVLCIGTAHDSK